MTRPRVVTSLPPEPEDQGGADAAAVQAACRSRPGFSPRCPLEDEGSFVTLHMSETGMPDWGPQEGGEGWEEMNPKQYVGLCLAHGPRGSCGEGLVGWGRGAGSRVEGGHGGGDGWGHL